jgi:hypothetical protein
MANDRRWPPQLNLDDPVEYLTLPHQAIWALQRYGAGPSYQPPGRPSSKRPSSAEIDAADRGQASTVGQPEPLLTIRDAAKALGLRPWALRMAIKAGTVPGYTPFNSRTRVRLSEVLAAIEASKIGEAA